jgi:hypothetical protein
MFNTIIFLDNFSLPNTQFVLLVQGCLQICSSDPTKSKPQQASQNPSRILSLYIHTMLPLCVYLSLSSRLHWMRAKKLFPTENSKSGIYIQRHILSSSHHDSYTPSKTRIPRRTDPTAQPFYTHSIYPHPANPIHPKHLKTTFSR